MVRRSLACFALVLAPSACGSSEPPSDGAGATGGSGAAGRVGGGGVTTTDSGRAGSTAYGGRMATGGAGGVGGSLSVAGSGGTTGGSVSLGGAPAAGRSSIGGASGSPEGGAGSNVGGASDGAGGMTAGSGGIAGAGGRSAGNGGMAGSGGAGGSAGTTGGVGGGGSVGCSVTPVDPNATTQAKNLLCYLYSIYGKNVLSGQQETSWSSPENDISWYNTNVSKYPAVLGGDYLYPSGTSTRAIAYWNAGGITMLRYHMGAPPNADTYENSQGSANIANVLASGTAENQSFRSKLDYAATELKKLADANVPVLWAPFHEYQPNGWFWWSKGSATQFVQLWRYMFDYLVTTKGLHNLVWLAPSSGSPDASWYPGKAYLDVAGPDTYATNPPFSAMFTAAKNIIGTTVPITLHETGVVPQPSTMFPTAAPWVLWNIWAGYQISENTVANVQSAYASSYTITRDEVPNLK